MAQFGDQVKMRFIVQLVKGISRVFEMLLKYFDGICLVFLAAEVLPVILALNLNDPESVVSSFG